MPSETSNYLYFSGEAKDTTQESAEEEAKFDMLKDYAIYLGSDINILEIVHREEIKETKDELYRTQGKVITEVDALARIYSTGCRFTEKYWEKWGRKGAATYYTYWVLGEVSKEFADDEKERIKTSRGRKIGENFGNSDLSAELRTDKDRYFAGDTVLIYFGGNERCYAYLLDFYGEGQVDILINSYRVEGSGLHKLTAIARYARSEMLETLVLIVADKPLDIETAVSQIHSSGIIDDLRDQGDRLKARYAGKSRTIIIGAR